MWVVVREARSKGLVMTIFTKSGRVLRSLYERVTRLHMMEKLDLASIVHMIHEVVLVGLLTRNAPVSTDSIIRIRPIPIASVPAVSV